MCVCVCVCVCVLSTEKDLTTQDHSLVGLGLEYTECITDEE